MEPGRGASGMDLVSFLKTYGGVESLPETLLIDRDGRIAGRHVGIVSKSDCEKEILQLVRK